MKVIAPGKLLLTGAYAVLDGAPALVAAVDRHAVADASQVGYRASAEVRAALGDEPAPEVDLAALHDHAGRKLGLGSSAAALVASLGARALSRGDDLRSPDVRARILRIARESHARAQGGGSGVDVAASVYGGVLRYELVTQLATQRATRTPGAGSLGTPRVTPRITPRMLPRGVVLVAFDSGISVRTSDMCAAVQARRGRLESAGVMVNLGKAAHEACAAVEAGDGRAFVGWAREFGSVLAELGRVADVPVVPPRFAELASLAERERGAFLPSGAGGGDVGVWLGMALPSAEFAARAETLSMRRLALDIDDDGVRPQSPYPPSLPARHR